MTDDYGEESKFVLVPDIKWVYIILGAGLVITFFFFGNETMSLPKYPMIFFLALCGFTAMQQSWEAFKRRGKGYISDLELGKGGHSTIHPYDIRMANRFDKESNKVISFACYALGGFYYSGVGVEGSDAFIVCPPEHVIDTEAGMVCFTKLFKVSYDEMPDYVQSTLTKLKGFNPKFVRYKDNLYFGMCSKIDGTATEMNFELQGKFLAFNKQINYMKTLIKEYSSQSNRFNKQNNPTIIIKGGEVVRGPEATQ